MSRVIGPTLVCLFAYMASAQADAPLPPPAVHRVTSLNGQFMAISDPATGTSVVKTSSGERLWSLPGWFRSIYISDSGRHLAIEYGGLNLVPLDSTNSLEILSFWDSGKKVRSVSLGEIVPDRSILKRTVSHYAWRTSIGVNHRDELVVSRIDGREFRFDMATGALR